MQGYGSGCRCKTMEAQQPPAHARRAPESDPAAPGRVRAGPSRAGPERRGRSSSGRQIEPCSERLLARRQYSARSQATQDGRARPLQPSQRSPREEREICTKLSEELNGVCSPKAVSCHPLRVLSHPQAWDDLCVPPTALRSSRSPDGPGETFGTGCGAQRCPAALGASDERRGPGVGRGRLRPFCVLRLRGSVERSRPSPEELMDSCLHSRQPLTSLISPYQPPLLSLLAPLHVSFWL